MPPRNLSRLKDAETYLRSSSIPKSDLELADEAKRTSKAIRKAIKKYLADVEGAETELLVLFRNAVVDDSSLLAILNRRLKEPIYVRDLFAFSGIGAHATRGDLLLGSVPWRSWEPAESKGAKCRTIFSWLDGEHNLVLVVPFDKETSKGKPIHCSYEELVRFFANTTGEGTHPSDHHAPIYLAAKKSLALDGHGTLRDYSWLDLFYLVLAEFVAWSLHRYGLMLRLHSIGDNGTAKKAAALRKEIQSIDKAEKKKSWNDFIFGGYSVQGAFVTPLESGDWPEWPSS